MGGDDRNRDRPGGESRVHVLDRRAARLVALAVFAAMVALLAYIHRDDLFAEEPPEATGPLAECLAARLGAVDKMIGEGVVSADQAQLFKTRAVALCRSLYSE